jgi:NAD(P)H-quinone oxidoreductase subunit L
MMAIANLELSNEILLTLAVYGGLAGVYLLVVPLALLFYLKGRWHQAGSVERTLVYGVMFAFFPGVLLFSPFLNFRPQARKLT